jgi:Nucleotidyltransferase
MFKFNGLVTENSEKQLRQYVDSTSVYRAVLEARKERKEVRGSMFWRELRGVRYLIRTSAAGAQRALGADGPDTQAMHERFMARKSAATERCKALEAKLSEMTQLNKVYQVGRVPGVAVGVLQALEAHGVADQFLTVGTHCLYAYEAACGVRIASDAAATRDIDLLFDTRQQLAFLTTLRRLDTSFIGVLRKADKTFRVRPDQLQTAVNDGGFEVDLIIRIAVDAEPHPLKMSDAEEDLWAVQVSSGNRMVSSRRFTQTVVSARGDMALMRTVHPLDFIQVKRALAHSSARDPLKARKDALQADVAQHLWQTYLQHLDTAHTETVAFDG